MESKLNILSFIFLVVLFVLLPRAALRSSRQLRQFRAGGTAVPRMRIVLSTMFSLSVLWAIAAVNATSMGEKLFSLHGAGAREWLIGAGALAVVFCAIPISRAMRTPEEELARLRGGIAPRDGRELAVFVLLAIMAGVAEESAYRGVAVWVLAPVFGSLLPAIALSAMAFGVAHAVQGGKAMAMTFAIALVFHGLVYLTGTLVIAMIVHAAYDVIAGVLARRRLLELEAAAATSAKTASP